MPIRRWLLALAAAVALVPPAFAEELSINVYVKGTGDPVPDATVVLGETGEYASTDARGRVVFDAAALPVHIKVLGTGYETDERDIDKTHADIYLFPVSVEGEGLEVIEERIAEKASKVTLSREELRKAPGSHGDPLKVIQSLPGVVSQGAALYVRGSSAGDNGVWVNRLPLDYLFHWGDIFGGVSTINPDLVQDFNAFLGGFPAEYPDRLGGLLDVQLRPPKKDRIHQNYRLAVNEAAFLVEGPVQKKDSFYAAGRHSYLDVVVTPDLANKLVGSDDSTISVITVPRYYDAQASWRHELGEGVMDLQYFAAGDELSIVNNTSSKTDPQLNGTLSAKQGYQTLGTTWQQRWRADWESVSTVAVNYRREEQTLGTDPTGQPYFLHGDYLLTTAQPELRWRRTATEGYFFGAEVFYGNYGIDLNVPRQPALGDVDFNLTTAQKYKVKKTVRVGTYHPYIKQRRQWGERFTTILGLRYSVIRGSGGVDMTGLSPRATVEYQFNPKTRLTATWGRYLQRPQESYLLDGFGNPHLDYTEAEHRIIGVQYQWNPVWKIQFEAYHKPMTHLAVALDETHRQTTIPTRAAARPTASTC